MLPLQDLRTKLLAQQRDLFRQGAQTEDDLLWLETDLEREVEERGQTDKMVQLLDRLDERMKREIEAIDRALTRLETGRAFTLSMVDLNSRQHTLRRS